MPSCTILHRCNDDTGCCRSPTLKCVPKQYEIVTQYFIVSTLKSMYIFFVGNHFQRHPFHFRSIRYVVRVSLKKNTFTITLNVTAWIKLYRFRPYSNQIANVLPCSKLAIMKITNAYVIVPKTKVTNAIVRKRASNTFPWKIAGNYWSLCNYLETNEKTNNFWKHKYFFHFLGKNRCIASDICTVPNCLYGLYNRTGGRCPTADSILQRAIDWI